jgi:hypothetical protein
MADNRNIAAYAHCKPELNFNHNIAFTIKQLKQINLRTCFEF